MTATKTEKFPGADVCSTAARVPVSPAIPSARSKCALVTLILLSLILITALQERSAYGVGFAAQYLRADPIRDLAVLANPSGSYTLFVADSKTGTIRYKEVEAVKDVEGWDIKDFAIFEIKGTNVPRQPIALAVKGTSLYVVDFKEETVHIVDLETRNSRLLLRQPVIDNPLSIAVSEGGMLAIGQDDKSVLLYDPAMPDTPPRALPDKIDNPVRLQFVPSTSQKKMPSLLVLDSDNEGQLTLYEPSDRAPESYTPRLIQIPQSVSSRLAQRADTALDLAFLDGNYYLTEGRNWAVFSELGLTSARWVLFPGMYKVTPERLRAAGSSLFLYDSKQGHVMRLSLKLMTVRLEVSASEANTLLTELYQALYDERKGSLPEREYVVDSSNKRLEELLKTEQVLAPGNYSPMFSPVEGDSTPASAYTGNLEFMLCVLNRRLNDWKCPDTRASAVGLERMKRSYGKGQVLVIPGLGVEQALYEGSIGLRGKSVEEAIKERLMVENPHEKFTTEYLMRIDPAYYRTVDYELTRRGYIMPSSFVSAPTLTPGTLLKIVQGREQVVAAGADCQSNWLEVAEQTRSEPVEELTEKLRSYAPTLEYLPRRATNLSDQAVLAEWKKLEIDKLEVIFEKPVEERGSRPALLTGVPPPCWLPLADKNAYIVGDVIRVSGARFRLLKKDGEVAQLRSEDLSRWGVDAVPDAAGEWSLKVVKPYVLGYRAIPLDGQPLFSEKQPNRKGQNLVEPELRFASDPHAVKPGATQDIWAKTDGKFFLPGFRWDIKLLTDSTTLAEDSVIRKWAARYPEKVYLWPTSGKPGGNTQPDTIAFNPGEPRAQETLEQVTSNRDLLRKAIKFPEAVKSGDIIIGLMERSGSVERLNSDFAWKEIKVDCPPDGPCPWEFVWLEPSEDKSSPPERLRHIFSDEKRVVRPREQINPQAERYWATNHGTHVGGLLASNYAGALGLLPDAKICWLELGNPPVPLPDQITQQNSNALRVINVSQEFLDNSYDWLKGQLGIEGAALNSKLFVVAAGNDGLDLNSDTNVKAPVAWLHQFGNNILSVSATDMEHKLLFKSPGSYRVNYGVKYVDLLAPGYEIYSSTEKNAYAATTGTSQAAPLVTATAALLAKIVGGAVDPSLLKGRLIYTADWEGSTLMERVNWDPNHSYRDKVWGGALNAGRALFGYDRDIFLYEFGQTTRHRAIHDIPDQVKLTIKNWKTTEAIAVRQPTQAGEKSEVALAEADSKIEFGQVLRMIRLRNGLYRIIYKSKTSPWNLKIIMNASIEGTIRYRNYEDVANSQLVERPISQQWETIRLETIIDYVGSFSKMGAKITFR
jgi:hypothetical protein